MPIIFLSLLQIGLKHLESLSTRNLGELLGKTGCIIDNDDDIIKFEYNKKTNQTFGNVLVGFETQNSKKLEEKMRGNGFRFQLLGWAF